jgi:hypothetical protein
LIVRGVCKKRQLKQRGEKCHVVEVPKREILPDPNLVMSIRQIHERDLQAARKPSPSALFTARLIHREKEPGKTAGSLHMAIGNIKPMVEVKSRRGWCELPGAC